MRPQITVPKAGNPHNPRQWPPPSPPPRSPRSSCTCGSQPSAARYILHRRKSPHQLHGAAGRRLQMSLTAPKTRVYVMSKTTLIPRLRQRSPNSFRQIRFTKSELLPKSYRPCSPFLALLKWLGSYPQRGPQRGRFNTRGRGEGAKPVLAHLQYALITGCSAPCFPPPAYSLTRFIAAPPSLPRRRESTGYGRSGLPQSVRIDSLDRRD